MKPTIEEVKLKYANAEKIKDAYDGSQFNLNEFDLETCHYGEHHGIDNDVYVVSKKEKRVVISLFDFDRGYAKILSYKKPSFRPIAMHCNHEQFYLIEPKLESMNVKYIDKFEKNPYLVNNGGFINGIITNIDTPINSKRTVYETWNEKLFLEACGIVVEEPKEETFDLPVAKTNEVYINGIKYVPEVVTPEFVEDKKGVVNHVKEECKHKSIEEIQGGQIERCRQCGKTWG